MTSLEKERILPVDGLQTSTATSVPPWVSSLPTDPAELEFASLVLPSSWYLGFLVFFFFFILIGM